MHFTVYKWYLKKLKDGGKDSKVGMAGQRQRTIKWNNTLVLEQSLHSKCLELHREGVRIRWQQQWVIPSLRCLSNIAGKFNPESHSGFPDSSTGKEPTCNAGDPGGWKGKPTPGLLPEKPHGQRSLEGYTPKACKESDTTEQLSTTPFTLMPDSSVVCIPNGLEKIQYPRSFRKTLCGIFHHWALSQAQLFLSSRIKAGQCLPLLWSFPGESEHNCNQGIKK